MKHLNPYRRRFNKASILVIDSTHPRYKTQKKHQWKSYEAASESVPSILPVSVNIGSKQTQQCVGKDGRQGIAVPSSATRCWQDLRATWRWQGKVPPLPEWTIRRVDCTPVKFLSSETVYDVTCYSTSLSRDVLSSIQDVLWTARCGRLFQHPKIPSLAVLVKHMYNCTSLLIRQF